MLLDQYPDTLMCTGPDGEKLNLPCRFRPAKITPFVRKLDGSEVQVKFDIAFPLDTPSLQLGTVFSAKNERGDVFVYEQELLTFHVGQLHCLGKC